MLSEKLKKHYYTVSVLRMATGIMRAIVRLGEKLRRGEIETGRD